MNATIPERRRLDGVSYAICDEGFELPVVDVTHPVFHLSPGARQLQAISEATTRGFERVMRIPRWARRYLERRSVIMKGAIDALNDTPRGMSAYICKLGPDALGRAYARRMDRRFAGRLLPVALRMRLQDVARLLADALLPLLATDASSVRLINIGGGTAIDSINALILLRREAPELLYGRLCLLQVIDIDESGPHFGARALAALQAANGPLHGVLAAFEHAKCDWSDTAAIRACCQHKWSDASVVAASSEGGLFEFGTDDAIVETLRSMRDCVPDHCTLIGSLLKDTPLVRAVHAHNRGRSRIMDLDGFLALLARAGWTIQHELEGNPLYHIVELRKLRSPYTNTDSMPHRMFNSEPAAH